MSALAQRGTAHPPRVVAVCVVGVLVAFLVQTSVLPAVGLSAAVPFVFATVAVLAVAFGGRTGVVTGFTAGLLLDLTGVAVLGVGALMGCLLGAAAAQVHPDRWWFSGVPSVWALVVAASTALTVGNAVLGQVPVVFGPGWAWVVVGAFVSVGALMPLRGWLREVVR